MKGKVLKKLHLFGLWRGFCLFCVNKIFVGTKPRWFRIKRKLLNGAGFEIGKNTKVVGPLICSGTLKIGDNCWIGRDLTVHGNGTVTIGNNCDLAPSVTFLTGGHAIGAAERRAGEGQIYSITVSDGCWIGANVTVLGNTTIHPSSVVASCACVVRDVQEDTLVGGVPASEIRRLDRG